MLGESLPNRYIIFIFFTCFFSCKNISESNGSYAHNNDPNPTVRVTDNIMPYIKYSEELIAFTNVSLIDGTGEPIKQNQTVIIENGFFKAIGNTKSTKIPKNTKIIDLNGKTIIPGIVGMHNHLHIPGFPDVGNTAVKLYLASGITTIQTCGATSTAREIQLSKAIEAGIQFGSDIIPSAPFITGKDGNPNMIIPRDEKHLRDTMQYYIDQGIKWFKIYRNTTPTDLKTIINKAHKNNAKVRGHLCSVTFEEATKLGIDGIEHGLNSTSDFRVGKEYGICNGDHSYMDNLNIGSQKVKDLLQLMIDNNVVLTSTLSIYEASIPNRAYADTRALKVMSSFLLDQYMDRRSNFDKNINDTTRNNRLKRIMQFEYQYYKMGGVLCAGVDAGRHVLPGFGDQRNYELLIETGFTPQEAIKIMTSNGAKTLERYDIGTIQIGKRADFVILNGNLEINTSTIKNVDVVFKKGIGYDPSSILKELEGQFGRE